MVQARILISGCEESTRQRALRKLTAPVGVDVAALSPVCCSVAADTASSSNAL